MGSQPEVIIEARGVFKSFKNGTQETQVLNGIDLDIYKGRLVAIFGASGSGKSTLLYLLSTLDTQYKGAISLLGKRIDQMSSNQLADFRNEHIGFVFQFHYLLPEFSVLENVCLPARKLGKFSGEEIEARALEKLDMLGLKGEALKSAKNLSGGQQQRVAIARALINEPTIIFGDEPTGNLDSKNSRLVFEIFRELSSTTNQTIVMVTHDQGFTNEVDNYFRMEDGKIIEAH